jgi:hypothetical protein
VGHVARLDMIKNVHKIVVLKFKRKRLRGRRRCRRKDDIKEGSR